VPASKPPSIVLHDWPGIQGRGEFVRLALEAAGVAWRDMALVPEADGGGIAGVERCLRDPALTQPPFEPPSHPAASGCSLRSGATR
jgi:glutathione S-transferase